jgi:hypothetical protein
VVGLLGGSAIEDMMGLLGGGGPGIQQPGMIRTTPEMQRGAPQAPPYRPPSMADRLQSRLGGLLSSVQPSAPAGYGSLLSQQEMQAAKPGKMQSLIERIAGLGSDVFTKQSYQRNLDHTLKLKEHQAEQDAAQKAAAQKQAFVTKLHTMYPDFGAMTPDAKKEAITGVYGEMLASGFFKEAAGVASAIPSMQTAPQAEKAPVLGSPEYLAAQEGLTAMKAKYRPPSQPRQPMLIAVQEDDGQGGSRTVLRPKEAGLEVPGPNTRTPAGIQKAIAENSAQISVIDKALQSVAANESAVGWKRGIGELPVIGGIGDAINQRRDPGGVETRALIANVGSLTIKDRSGAAVTVSESARLRPFIPSIADTPAAIRTKLNGLRAAVAEETRLLQQGGPGHAPSKGSGSVSGAPPSYEQWKASRGH